VHVVNYLVLLHIAVYRIGNPNHFGIFLEFLLNQKVKTKTQFATIDKVQFIMESKALGFISLFNGG